MKGLYRASSILAITAAGIAVSFMPFSPAAASEQPEPLDPVSEALINQAGEECVAGAPTLSGDEKGEANGAEVDWEAVDCAMSIMDPKRLLRDISAGAVLADEKYSQQQRLVILDPDEDGGDPARFALQQESRRVWIEALRIGGSTNPQQVFDQALEWELGVIECVAEEPSRSTDDDSESSERGDGDWLTKGTSTYAVAQKMFDVLTQDYGVSGAFAAGVLGNVQQESSFQLEVVNRSSGAKGLFQFYPASKAAPWVKDGWTVENQVAAVWGLEFSNRAVWSYVQSNAPGLFQSMEDWISTDDPVAASEAFLYGYERPGKNEALAAVRAENARSADRVFNKARVQAQKSKWKFDTAANGDTGDEPARDLSHAPSCGSSEESYPVTGAKGKVNANGWAWPTDTPVVYQDFHLGMSIDLGSSSKGPIFAAYDGVVVKAGGDGVPFGSYCPTYAWWRGENETVMIKHSYRGQTLYSSANHVGKGSIIVKPGQRVQAGQQIASEGMSGCTSAPHNHFFMTNSPTLFNGNIDPFPYIGKP